MEGVIIIFLTLTNSKELKEVLPMPMTIKTSLNTRFLRNSRQ